MRGLIRLFKSNFSAQNFVISISCTVFITLLVNIFDVSKFLFFPNGLFSLFVLVLLLFSFDLVKKIHDHCKRSWFYLYPFITMLLFSEILGSAMRINENGGSINISKENMFIFLLASVSWAIPLCGAILYVGKNIFEFIQHGQKIKKISVIKIWIILFLAWIPCYIAFYPAVFSYDVDWQLLQYFRGRGSYSTHHPIAHTLFLGWIIDIGERLFGEYNHGVALYALLQMSILSWIVAYSLSWMSTIYIPKIIWVLTSLYFIFMPIYPVMGISTTKDVIFSVWFMGAFILLAQLLTTSTLSRKKLGLLGITLFFMQLFRNNAVYGLYLVLICLILIKPKRQWQLILTITISIVLSKGAQQMLRYYTQASEGSVAEVLSIPCQQIARVHFFFKDSLSEEDIEAIYEFFPKESLEDYRWEISDPIKKNLDTEMFRKKPKEFAKLWISLGIKYPREYLSAFLYNNLGLWFIGDISHISTKGSYLEVGFKRLNSEIPEFQSLNITKKSLWPYCETFYKQIIVECVYLRAPIVALLFSPAFYVWCIVGSTITILVKKKNILLPLPIFLLSYCITLLGGPCVLPRYCINYIMCVPILLCLLFFEQKN